MNKSFKSVWCEKTGTFVAASEVAKGRGKKSSSRKALVAIMMAGAAFGAMAGSTDGGNASATNAVSVGPSSTATAQDGTAVGFETKASGVNSTAIGNQVEAAGAGSIAIQGNGVTTVATDAASTNAIAIGQSSQVRTSASAIVLGANATATGAADAVVMGRAANAAAASAIAIGASANATAANSVALGAGSTTTANLGAAGYNPGSTGLSGTASAANDTYHVDQAADSIVENANEGVDTVNTSINYTLGSNLENLNLLGTAALNGTGNNVLDGGAGADTLRGGAGDDTYYVDQAGDSIVENANEGVDTVNTQASYTLGSNLENLTLGGSAAINGTGNALNNTIHGNSANNVLDGGAGADTLRGGAGNDTYYVDQTGDLVVENASEGMDTVISTISYALNANVENLTLGGTTAINGTGNELNNAILGNAANNVLDGGAGADTLDGGAGADTLRGGTGNDVYYVDQTADVVVENANEGTDTVNSAVTYVLGANIENLTLQGGRRSMERVMI
ncbi:ESPR-type extended signal peptide-containing protein [Variovorax sp. J31P179]|uniref:ESPR-type extended signal peptide-containing protein n=1 Tax=Variovorax sp. J31P179 TaxID=3053508 RepID=UPI002577806B|nr:ESPR-type extended signal peptide-containing protein [Variovorax sp. J31P179]MDM0081674.1 ESPR-type extended signal peptide-containing protein [Variovorax sp. J31P179]